MWKVLNNFIMNEWGLWRTEVYCRKGQGSMTGTGYKVNASDPHPRPGPFLIVKGQGLVGKRCQNLFWVCPKDKDTSL